MDVSFFEKIIARIPVSLLFFVRNSCLRANLSNPSHFSVMNFKSNAFRLIFFLMLSFSFQETFTTHTQRKDRIQLLEGSHGKRIKRKRNFQVLNMDKNIIIQRKSSTLYNLIEMHKEFSDQSTIQPYYFSLPSVNCNSYFPQVFYVPQENRTQIDYKKEYELLKLKYEELETENRQLKKTITELNPIQKTKRIIKRRRQEDIQRQIKCPYLNCNKEYASDVALNLHIKEKHNGGTKKQRERYAKKVIQAFKRHQEPPKDDINLPPGYLEEFKKSILDHLDSDSSMLCSEESS